LRAAAEGRVFPFFDEDPAVGYVVKELPSNFTMYLLGIDYGISNPFVAQLWGLSGGVWYCIKDFEWDSAKRQKQKTNPEYIEDLARLCYVGDRRIAPDQVLIPPEEPGFQRELMQCAYPELHRSRDADNSILPGIEDLTTLLSLGKFKIFHKCESTIYGLSNLLWDEKKQKQGIDMFLKGGSGAPDHAADCSRYIGRRAKHVLARMGLI